MVHRFSIRVYHEDTDLAGIVYHANYLKYIERARSEWVRGLGLDQRALKARGLVFAVRRVEADYLRPALYDDVIEVETALLAASGARAVLNQVVTRGCARLFAAKVTLVALTASGAPTRLPKVLRHLSDSSGTNSP